MVAVDGSFKPLETEKPETMAPNNEGLTKDNLVLYIGIAVGACCCVLFIFAACAFVAVKVTAPSDVMIEDNPVHRKLGQLERQQTMQKLRRDDSKPIF